MTTFQIYFIENTDRVLMDGQATTTALAATLTTLGGFGLLDLSRQQRNLLLLRPVFQLERYKMMQFRPQPLPEYRHALPCIVSTRSDDGSHHGFQW
ncbi:hypothetical protein [Paraburkholderia sp. UCT31]|uniref:hypothetical protein n=1 Tax=Paraburkholderia sp. UCT31 TaxID=2615209 RepID=UPI00223B7957|nr:hypothetical protein [Paraburkholderia sp. UCT31]